MEVKQYENSRMRKALTNLANRVFSPMGNYDQFDTYFPGNEIVTNLQLQMALYFNVYFFPFWIITMAVMLEVKYEYLLDTYKVVIIAVLCLFSAVEIVRLYLGYLGNLKEKVPELAGFFLLTLTLQVPSIAFLLIDSQTIRLPLEVTMNAIYALFIVVELITGLLTISAMNRQQAMKFQLHEMFEFDTIANDIDDLGVTEHSNLRNRQ